MALFGKKKESEICAVCGKERKGGFLRGLFQSTVDSQYVCSDCYGNVDIQSDILSNMSIDAFKEYLSFRESNQKLKEKFTATNTIDFGILDDKIVFDRNHVLMCLDKNLDKTIFETGSLTSFVIREDNKVIFEGNANGLNFYETDVYNQLNIIRPSYMEYLNDMHMFRHRISQMSAEQQETARGSMPVFHTSEPFQNFYIDLCFNHPYWNNMTLDMSGPRFSNSELCLDEYISAYRLSFTVIEHLANELMYFAFPVSDNISAPAVSQNTQSDIADALLKFKQLLDMGAITEEEFAAKKQQLLGL